MAFDINNINISGRLVKDVEVKYFGAENKTVGRFTVAVDRPKKVNGQWQSDSSFFDVVKFDVDRLQQYLTKGRPVIVNGYLHQSTWLDKNTQEKKSRIEIMAEKIMLLDIPKKNTTQNQNFVPVQNQPNDAYSQTVQAFAPMQPQEMDLNDSEIPF